MNFEYELKPQLSRLAWAATARKQDPVVRVVHGPWVEVHDEAFVEGAWDGPFGDLRFDRAMMLAGSGARLTQDGLVFAGHSDLHERLYVIRGDDEVHVSPSLALVLAVAGAALDPKEPHYYLNFIDAYRAGIRHTHKRIRLSHGRSAEMHDVCNLRMTPDLDIERVEKPWARAPENYGQYASLMQDTLDRVVRNAGDPARRHTFRPVCMISTGYDSVAVAALASKAGCREAVTYRESGSKEGPVNDDGSDVGRVLGYRTTVYERGKAETAVREGEEEFYMEPWGVDRETTPMETQLVGSMLLTGRSTQGWQLDDRRWGLPTNNGLPHLQRPTPYMPGCALTDFRLRVGFLHFTVPAIGAIHAPILNRLTMSDEMRPWRLGVPYDKPIPRRMAEEAGVPRHMFGASPKKGGPTRPPVARSIRARLANRYRKATYWAPLRVLIRGTIGNRLHPRWRLGSFDVQAGAAKMVERYRRALSI